jgi:hypothetical protein
LDAVRAKENRLALIAGLFTWALASLALLLVVVAIERVAQFGTTGRTVLFTLLACGIGGTFAYYAGAALLRVLGILKSAGNDAVASKVGMFFPHIHDRLLDALQIYESRDALKSTYSVDLMDASFGDLWSAIQPLDFSQSVQNDRVRKLGKFVSYAAGVMILMFLISPLGLYSSLFRVFNFNKTYASPLPIEFSIEPGNKEVVRGQSVSVVVRTTGKPVQSITLHTRPSGQFDFDTQELTLGNDGAFHTELTDLKNSVEYFASAEDVSSLKYSISVLDRPLIRSFRATVTPPAYTRIPAKTLDDNIGDISAYPGSKVKLDITSSKKVVSGEVVFKSGGRLPLLCSDARSSATFTVKENTTYHLLLRDENGLSTIDPVEYSVTVIPDEYPTAEIVTPGKNVDLAGEMSLDLFVRIKDDFGFTKVRLGYRLVQSKYAPAAEEFTFIELPLPPNTQNAAEFTYHWDLSSLSLVPEDAVAYYVEVYDNDNVNGPKVGKSAAYLIRLPSLEEVFSDVDKSQDQTAASMQEVSKEAEDLKKQVDDMHREMQENQNKMDWHDQKKVDEMLQQYQSLKSKLEENAKKLNETMAKMESNKVLSNETMEKYLEMEKLMDELKSPELQDALKKLQQSMKQLSPDEMKQAMNQMQFSEEQFQKSLERTIELLKRIRIEQKLDEVIKRTEELKKEQENLQSEAKNTSPSDSSKRSSLANKQEDLQKEMQQLESESANLKQSMEEFPKDMPVEQMSKAQKDLADQQLQQQMEKSAQQMQSGDMQQAQSQQGQTSQGLDQYEKEMQDVQKQLQDKQQKEIVNQLRKQLDNVIELSKRQKDLKAETQTFDPNSQRFRKSAEEQDQTMTDLGNVANALTEIAKKSFAVSPQMGKEIGDALHEMDNAIKGMESRIPSTASQQQGEAMASLNRAAMMMQNALSSMQAGGKGSGMSGLMGQLGQMVGQQSGINQGTKDAMGMGQGQGMSPEQQAEYQRLAGQQAAVQKSLKQLAEEAKNSGDYSKILGDLDKAAQEMQEVQTDLSQGNVNPETTNKEDHILSRLLDSQRSTRERDYEKRRKSESGKDLQQASPAEFDLATQEGKNKLREELLKVLEGKYSKDYQQLIKNYFEALEKAEQPQQ